MMTCAASRSAWIGLFTDRGGVRFETIPECVHVEDQGGHVRVGQRRQTGACRVVAGVEATRGLAQRVNWTKGFAQQQHGQAGREAQRREHQQSMGERRERVGQHQALCEPGADQARRRARPTRFTPSSRQKRGRPQPRSRQARGAGRLSTRTCRGSSARTARWLIYQRNSTVPDGFGGLAPAAMVDACGNCAASHVCSSAARNG